MRRAGRRKWKGFAPALLAGVKGERGGARNIGIHGIELLEVPRAPSHRDPRHASGARPLIHEAVRAVRADLVAGLARDTTRPMRRASSSTAGKWRQRPYEEPR